MFKNSYSIEVICDLCKEQINKNDSLIILDNQIRIGYLKDLTNLSNNSFWGPGSYDDATELIEFINKGAVHLNCFSEHIIKINRTTALKVFA